MEDKIKILVVDDEKEACGLVAQYLGMKGYDALMAYSAEEALPIIKEQNPKIILLDIGLPGMSGTDLLKLVRQFNTTIKVAIVSGYAGDLRNDAQFKELNVSEFVEKPISFDTFDSVLGRLAK